MTNTRLASLKDMEKKAPTIREKVLVVLSKSPYPLTPDEIAAKIGTHYANVRPRMTELKIDGLIEDSGDTGLSVHGKSQILWKIK